MGGRALDAAFVRHTRRGGWKWLAVSLVMYLSALLSKPTAALLPALLLLVDYWPLQRLNLRALVEKVPFFVIGGVFGVITLISHSRTAGISTAGEADLWRTALVTW